MLASSAVTAAPTLPARMTPVISGHELPEHGVADEVGDVDLGPEDPQLLGRGDRDGHADEEKEHADDGVGPVAHEEHLVPGLPGIDALALLEIHADVEDLVAEHGQEPSQAPRLGRGNGRRRTEEPASRPPAGARRLFRPAPVGPPGEALLGPGQRVRRGGRRRRPAGSPSDVAAGRPASSCRTPRRPGNRGSSGPGLAAVTDPASTATISAARALRQEDVSGTAAGSRSFHHRQDDDGLVAGSGAAAGKRTVRPSATAST